MKTKKQKVNTCNGENADTSNYQQHKDAKRRNNKD